MWRRAGGGAGSEELAYRTGFTPVVKLFTPDCEKKLGKFFEILSGEKRLLFSTVFNLFIPVPPGHSLIFIGSPRLLIGTVRFWNILNVFLVLVSIFTVIYGFLPSDQYIRQIFKIC